MPAGVELIPRVFAMRTITIIIVQYEWILIIIILLTSHRGAETQRTRALSLTCCIRAYLSTYQPNSVKSPDSD